MNSPNLLTDTDRNHQTEKYAWLSAIGGGNDAETCLGGF